MSVILNHSDDVSGTTIFDDGTKMYWTEGRSSSAVVIFTNGRRLEICLAHPENDEERRLLAIEEEIEVNGADEYRTMTSEEEEEWYVARYGEKPPKEIAHFKVPSSGYEIEQFTADINVNTTFRCHWCDEEFTPQFVMINGTHRFYCAVDGKHVHIEIGGEIQI